MRLAVLLVLAAGAAYVVARILAPFSLAIVGAAVLAVLARPVHEAVKYRVPGRSLAAFLVTAALFLLVLIPVGVMAALVANGIESGISVVSSRAQEFFSERSQIWDWLVNTAGLIGIEEPRLSATLQEQASRVGSLVAGETFGILSGLGGWMVQAAVGIFTLFYLLRDGDAFLGVVRWLIPLDREATSALLSRTYDVVTATVLGTLVVAIVQGVLGGLLFWALGLPGPALWGAVMAVLSLLPAIGPPVVWVPAAVLLAIDGELVKAAVLAGTGTLILSTVDNVLRSILVGERAQLHSLVAFFSVLGGLIVFGLAGFVLGPILFVVALSVLEIARVALSDEADGDQLSPDSMVLSRITG